MDTDIKVLWIKSFKTKSVGGFISRTTVKLIQEEGNEKALLFKVRQLIPDTPENDQLIRNIMVDYVEGRHASFVRYYSKAFVFERKFSIKVSTFNLISEELIGLGLFSPFSDNEADGIVFCGKCGKMKEP